MEKNDKIELSTIEELPRNYRETVEEMEIDMDTVKRGKTAQETRDFITARALHKQMIEDDNNTRFLNGLSVDEFEELFAPPPNVIKRPQAILDRGKAPEKIYKKFPERLTWGTYRLMTFTSKNYLFNKQL
ncbi:unnamed protein product, partial [marine sediment metagenome]